MKRTESVLVGRVCAVLALLFAYLCVYGLDLRRHHCRKTSIQVETIVQVQDQPLFSLLGLLVACGILRLFSKVEGKNPPAGYGDFFACLGGSAGNTVGVGRSRRETPGGRGRDRGRSPSGHESELYGAEAKRRLREPAPLSSAGIYGFFSACCRRFSAPKTIWRCSGWVNVAFLTLAYGGTLRLLWLMTKKARTVRYGALLLLLCLQPILYVTFLYGNMASIACTLWAMCCLCRLARDGGAWRLIPAGLLCGLSVMMKPNGWIPVIAMLIVTGLWFLSEKKWKLLPLLLLLAAGPLAFLPKR